MKRFALIFFTFIISAIIVTSFFFIGENEVEDYTTDFIIEIIEENYYEKLSDEDNKKIQQFFLAFQDQGLPKLITEDIVIRYYDVFTDPIFNERFLQYISVKYEEVDETTFDTNIYMEYISYNEKGAIDEIYFGQMVVRSYDRDFTEIEITEITPMEKQ